MMRECYYILDADGKTPKAVDMMTWARWLGTGVDRHVGDEILPNGVRVSMVFLGLDHLFGKGPPLLWETMPFSPDGESFGCARYSTYEEAVAGHKQVVEAYSTWKPGDPDPNQDDDEPEGKNE